MKSCFYPFSLSCFSTALFAFCFCLPNAASSQDEIIYPGTVLPGGYYQLPSGQAPNYQPPVFIDPGFPSGEIQQPAPFTPQQTEPILIDPMIVESATEGVLSVEPTTPDDTAPPVPTPIAENPLQKELETAKLNLSEEKEKTNSLTSKLTELQGEFRQEKTKNGELETKVVTLGETVETLTAEMGELTKAVPVFRTKAADLSEKLDAAKIKNEILQAKLETAMESLEAEANTRIEMQADAQAAAVKAEQLAREKGELESEIQLLTKQAKANPDAANANAGNPDAMAESESRIEELNAANEKLTNQIAQATDKNVALTASVQTLIADKKRLTADVVSFTEKATEANEAAEAAKAKLAEGTKSDDQQADELAKQKSNYDELKVKFDELESTHAKLKRGQGTTKTELADSKAEVKRLTKLNEELIAAGKQADLNLNDQSGPTETDALAETTSDSESAKAQEGDWSLTNWMAVLLLSGLALSLLVIAREDK